MIWWNDGEVIKNMKSIGKRRTNQCLYEPLNAANWSMLSFIAAVSVNDWRTFKFVSLKSPNKETQRKYDKAIVEHLGISKRRRQPCMKSAPPIQGAAVNNTEFFIQRVIPIYLFLDHSRSGST